MNYKPKKDIPNPLDHEIVSYHQLHSGIIRRMIELGRVGIGTEVSLLSSHNAYLREGHFKAVLYAMGCLKHKHNLRLAIHPNYLIIDYDNFKHHDWSKKLC